MRRSLDILIDVFDQGFCEHRIATARMTANWSANELDPCDTILVGVFWFIWPIRPGLGEKLSLPTAPTATSGEWDKLSPQRQQEPVAAAARH